MKKLCTLLILAFICVLTISGQSVLRENVCVVKPTYSPSSVTFIKDLSKNIRKDGYKAAADVLESYTKGGFGSGFIYTNFQTGKSYIVTNRHVVAQADYATIEFQYSEKPAVKFDNCPIVAVDEQVDLALIELPSDANLSKGLKIRESLPEEGSEVITAGFPGLGDTPSWQFGQGVVANNSVFDKILVGNSTIGAIQHTAQVDAGSSGGPLLVKNKNGEYEIVGVNAWKIKDRESANFAIASKALNIFLAEYADNKVRNTETDLTKRAKDFANALKKDYMEILPYISSDYVSNVSFNHFYELINAVPDSIDNQIIARFNNGHPIDGVRIALAYIMYKKIAGNNLSYASDNGIRETKYADVTFNSNKKDFSATWIFEQGEWRLQNLPSLKLTDLENQGVSKRYGYRNSVKAGIELPISKSDTWGTRYSLTYGYTYYTFFVAGLSVGTGTISYNPKLGWADDEGIKETKRYYSGSVSMGGQLPIKVSSFYLIPNAKGFIEINSNDVSGALGYIGGLEGAYKLSRKTYLLFGLSYKYRSYNTNDSQWYKNHGTFGVQVGITW